MEIDFSSYDFADFGCSNGASIEQAQKLFDGQRGLGIDISETKVNKARELGFDVHLGDLTSLEVPDDTFRFVTMVHFLEHLPSLSLAKRCIHTGVRTARDFVFIRQPWFSTDSYLAQHGLKHYWSDWSGHLNRMDILAFYIALRNLPKNWDWRLFGRYAIENSEHSSIHPLASGEDQHEYVPGTHGFKPSVVFKQPVFKETVCLIYRPDYDVDTVVRRVSALKPLLRS